MSASREGCPQTGSWLTWPMSKCPCPKKLAHTLCWPMSKCPCREKVAHTQLADLPDQCAYVRIGFFTDTWHARPMLCLISVLYSNISFMASVMSICQRICEILIAKNFITSRVLKSIHHRNLTEPRHAHVEKGCSNAWSQGLELPVSPEGVTPPEEI